MTSTFLHLRSCRMLFKDTPKFNCLARLLPLSSEYFLVMVDVTNLSLYCKLRVISRLFPKGFPVFQPFLWHNYFKWQWLHCAEVSCRLQKCHRPTRSHTAVTIPLIICTNLMIIGIWVCACACALSRFHCFLPFMPSEQRINSQRLLLYLEGSGLYTPRVCI
jgi:hypothetical protein